MNNTAGTTIRIAALFLAVTLPLTQAAYAADISFTVSPQADPAAQAAAQAVATQQVVNQQVMQANQQAAQDAQQANQQAMQNAQQAADGQYSSTSRSTLPPRLPGPLPVPSGPVPAEIANAHKVFLTNAGADQNFPVDSNTAYNAVYSALQSWGHYQFVSSPQEADMIFSLQDIAPLTGLAGDLNAPYAVTSPTFILNISDAKTNNPLWTTTSPMFPYGSSSKRAKQLTLSVGNLVSGVKILAGEPLTQQESNNLNPPLPHHHTGLILALAIGAPIIFGAIITPITLSNMKNSQDAFCNAHGIPLSECAGG